MERRCGDLPVCTLSQKNTLPYFLHPTPTFLYLKELFRTHSFNPETISELKNEGERMTCVNARPKDLCSLVHKFLRTDDDKKAENSDSNCNNNDVAGK
jgi:hypothetical protein